MNHLAGVHAVSFKEFGQPGPLLVMPFSEYTFVPLSRGLVRKLALGWPAVAYRATAGLSQDGKHRELQVRVIWQLPLLLFLVRSGVTCSLAPAFMPSLSSR